MVLLYMLHVHVKKLTVKGLAGNSLKQNYHTLYTLGVFGDKSEVEKLLELGTQSLREGHLSDALLHYSAAIGMQTTNMYFVLALLPSRPTVHLGLVTVCQKSGFLTEGVGGGESPLRNLEIKYDYYISYLHVTEHKYVSSKCCLEILSLFALEAI